MKNAFWAYHFFTRFNLPILHFHQTTYTNILYSWIWIYQSWFEVMSAENMINDESPSCEASCLLLAACRRVVRWQVHRMHDLLHESPLQLLQPPQQCRGHCGQLRSSPRCTRGNHSQLSCLITAHAQWEIAEVDVIEQLSGKVLLNHKMPLPKWKFSASKASIKVLESIRTRLTHDTTLHSGATPLLSMVS